MNRKEFLNLSTTGKIAFVSNDAAPKKEVRPDKARAKLLQLARQIIGDCNNKTESDIILQLQRITGVNGTRANNGFNMMLAQKAISWGIEDRYYLTGSTPF